MSSKRAKRHQLIVCVSAMQNALKTSDPVLNTTRVIFGYSTFQNQGLT